MPARELDSILQKIVLKEYYAGQVIWRTEKPLNILGLVDAGEIALEHRIHGVTTYTAHLSVGDWVDSNRWKLKDSHMSIAQALTNVRLYIIRREPAFHTNARVGHSAAARNPWIGEFLWVALVLIVVLSLGFHDLRRVLSDALVLGAEQRLSLPTQLEEPARLYSYASALDPQAPFAYNQQGYLLYQAGDKERAKNLFSAAVDVDPASGAALNNLAVSYFMQGQLTQALQIQQNAVFQVPDNAQARDNLGVMLVNLGQNQAALHEFREASLIQPDWALPILHEALLYLQMKEYSKSQAAAAKAIQLAPQQWEGYEVLTIALYGQDRDVEALEAVNLALAFSTDQSVPSFYKALILSRQGKRDDALVILNQLLQTARDPWDASRIQHEIIFLELQQPAPATISH